MGLWLLGVRGQVVAHIGKDIGVVVPLNVLVVVIRGGLLKGTVSRSPAYYQSLRRGVVVAYVSQSWSLTTPFRFIGVALTTLWLSSMMSSPGLANSEASAQAIVLARYTCWGPRTRNAAR